MTTLLDIEQLTVTFNTRRGALTALREISFSIEAGKTVCIVGESGSGKSVTAKSIMRLIDYENGHIKAGKINFLNKNLVELNVKEMRSIRGKKIAMIFQEPMAAFDPVFSIGHQIVETIIEHEKLTRKEALLLAEQLLSKVGIPEPKSRLNQYPNELSGGMLQRAMIAMALACKPDLLIADEPTTALDVTIQAQILQLLKQLQTEYNMSILLITHDLGVAAEIADKIIVMYAGAIIEEGEADAIFNSPQHPYTIGLLQSIAKLDTPRTVPLQAIEGTVPSLDQLPKGCVFHPRCSFASPLCQTTKPELIDHITGKVACHHAAYIHEKHILIEHDSLSAKEKTKEIVSFKQEDLNSPKTPYIQVKNLTKHYPLKSNHLFKRKPPIQAVEHNSFIINRNEIFGIIGESGSGKSTLGRLIVQLESATKGDVYVEEENATQLKGEALRLFRKDQQVVFQDPYSSLDSRWTVGKIIAEPLKEHTSFSRSQIKERVLELLQLVGLTDQAYDKYPHEFSGGQRQRIAIARAIALNPKFILADEAVSALDVSVQAQIINLLKKLKEQLGLTIVFIGHGLQIVRHISDRVAVMYLGKIVEIAPSEQLFSKPLHPYTRALIDSIPEHQNKEKRLATIKGEIPSPSEPPSGCRFHTRCALATDKCKSEEPAFQFYGEGRQVSCHYPLVDEKVSRGELTVV